MVIDNKIRQFENLRKQSIFCKLSLDDHRIDWKKCHNLNSFPYAFILSEDHNLIKIDGLIENFQIERKGSADFKSRLRDSIYEDSLNQYNAIEAALSELLIADYLLKDEEIIGLEAHKDYCGADIKSKNNKTNTIYYTEVKYLGQIPELDEHVKNQIKNNVLVSACWLPDLLTLYTYLTIRMVDAIIQLDKLSLGANEQKRIFIVIKSGITSNRNIVQEVNNKKDWNREKLIVLCQKLKLCPDKYLKKSISEWLKKVDHLMIGYLNPSYNIDLKLKL